MVDHFENCPPAKMTGSFILIEKLEALKFRGRYINMNIRMVHEHKRAT